MFNGSLKSVKKCYKELSHIQTEIKKKDKCKPVNTHKCKHPFLLMKALEKELRRQLQREKDKNRNLEHRAHEYREENLKLRLAVPDDDENIASYKSYDIPNNAHSSSRQQTKRVSIYCLD